MKFPKISWQKIKTGFYQLPIVVGLLNWMKTRSFPGFYGIPIYDVLIFLLNEIGRYSLIIRANSIAYSFFLALFPALLLLFTLVPYFSEYFYSKLPIINDSNHNYTELIIDNINQFIPGIDVQITNQESLENTLEDNIFTNTVQDIVENPRYGLLSLGFLLAIYFASNGMLAMMRGFEKSNKETFKRRAPIRMRGIAIGLTFLMGLLFISSIIIIILGDFLIELISNYSQWTWFSAFAFQALRVLIFLSLFYFGIGFIYRYGAAARRRFPIFSPGASLATFLSILSSLAFSYYVENFSQYNKLYGSIGTIIILLLWLQLNAQIILIGFELNASIAINRDLKTKIEDEDADV